LFLSGVPFRWVLVILAAAIAVTYGVDAFLDDFSSEG